MDEHTDDTDMLGVPVKTYTPEIRVFDDKIAAARKEKESAIDGQDFEKAASLMPEPR